MPSASANGRCVVYYYSFCESDVFITEFEYINCAPLLFFDLGK
jgi:hypothetical protein